jgi:hypothetical protein
MIVFEMGVLVVTVPIALRNPSEPLAPMSENERYFRWFDFGQKCHETVKKVVWTCNAWPTREVVIYPKSQKSEGATFEV